MKNSLAALVVLVSTISIAQTTATTTCSPVEVPVLSGRNMFTPKQEQELGEILAERQEREFGVIDDDAVTTHMQQIVDRLLAVLPPNTLRAQVFLSNEPVLNAWSIPGRIYVTRKIVAFTASEDEMAGLLAHELGHIITRQAGVEYTARIHQMLNLNELGPDADLYSIFQQYIEAVMRDPGKLRYQPNEEQRDQLLADRTAMLMVARAGYSGSAFVEHFDRLAETKGKKGSWLSELFGTTAPDQKRLRELYKQSQATPDACAAPHANDNGFKQWQARVIAYSGSGHRESLHGILQRTLLDPPLRGDITQLRFSRDGNYILAQDPSSIWVLRREPMMWLFRIDAPAALPAHFSPDSSSVVFADDNDRVERWSVNDRQRTFVTQLTGHKECLHRELSPDGTLLACTYPQLGEGATLQGNYLWATVVLKLGVTIFDVDTGTQKYDKADLYQVTFGPLNFFMQTSANLADVLNTHFSPDGKYFITTSPDRELTLQLPAFTPIDLPGRLRSMLHAGFAFLDGGRMAVHNRANPEKSAIMSFPDGEVEKEFHFGNHLRGTSKGNWLIEALQGGDAHFGLVDPQTEKMRIVSRTDGLDAWGDFVVNDLPNGEIGLYSLAAGADAKKVASASLPLGPLTTVQAFDISLDGALVAVSGRSRGAVWNIQTGQRAVHLRGFQSAYFGSENTLFADMTAFSKQPRTLVRITAAPPSVHPQLDLNPETNKGLAFRHVGEYLAVFHYGDKGKAHSLEMRDIGSGATLWTHALSDSLGPVNMPTTYVRNGHVALVFSLDAAKRQAKEDPVLSQAATQQPGKDRVTHIVLLLDAKTGQTQGAVAIAVYSTDSSIFSVVQRVTLQVEVAGDRLLIGEENRVSAYSISGNKEAGAFFGNAPVANSARNLLATRSDRWHVTLRDLNTLARVDDFNFASPVAAMKFSADGSKLYVLTQGQTFYVLSTGGPAGGRAETATQ